MANAGDVVIEWIQEDGLDPRSTRQNDQQSCLQRQTNSRITRIIGLIVFLAVLVSYSDWMEDSSIIHNMETNTIGHSQKKTNTTTTNSTILPHRQHPLFNKSSSIGNKPHHKRNDKDGIAKNKNATKKNKKTSLSSSWIDSPFEEQPGCRLLWTLNEQNVDNRSMLGILNQFGKYVAINNRMDQAHRPRYDHQSCFIMKPRYNCARNSTTAAGVNATDFALILQQPKAKKANHTSSSNNEVCDLQKFVHDAGGPSGIGRRMMYHYQTKKVKKRKLKKKRKKKSKRKGNGNSGIDSGSSNTNSNSGSNKRHVDSPSINVLLVGTSLFRQIFEALACGFSEQMTQVHVQLGGPKFNRQHRYMNASKIGSMVDLDFVNCYDPSTQSQYAKFFAAGVEVPLNHDQCNDNLGMAEFETPTSDNSSSSSTIRFYYIFRPWAWTNVTPALQALGIDRKHKLDFVLWQPRDKDDEASWQYHNTSSKDDASEDLESIYQDMFDIRQSSNGLANTQAHDAHKVYRRIQKRDIGRYFGADNPWIFDPPDREHPCMPGMPDDKVNFLLWYMLSLSAL